MHPNHSPGEDFVSTPVRNPLTIVIFWGGMTIAIGLIVIFFLDATPATARWLNEEEKIIALERLRSSRTASEKHGFNKAQLFEALRDPRLYLVFLLLTTTGLPNGGLTAFGPTIISVSHTSSSYYLY
jgi:ACS family allantoate permease-like MFS transporter